MNDGFARGVVRADVAVCWGEGADGLGFGGHVGGVGVGLGELHGGVGCKISEGEVEIMDQIGI